MNANYRKIAAKFGPEAGFEVIPSPIGPFRAALESRFEGLKDRLLLQRLKELADANLNSRLRRAANEAAALAWITPYPLLVFPALFEERSEAALAGLEPPTPGGQCSDKLLAV